MRDMGLKYLLLDLPLETSFCGVVTDLYKYATQAEKDVVCWSISSYIIIVFTALLFLFISSYSAQP